MNLLGKISGFIIGGVVTSSLVGAIFGSTAGHFLFDYKVKVKKSEPDIEDNDYYDNVDIFNNIIKLCYALINIKGNILIGEIDAIKYFFKNEFKFDKKDIKQIDNIIYNLGNNNIQISIVEVINGINSYCKYEEKIAIVQLLFFLAISDKRISDEESNFIFDATQKLNIQSNDYIKIKNLFIVNDENYFTILKVSENATNNEIKTAYRRLVNLYHPDKHRSEEYYDREYFEKIVNAYQELRKLRNF
ncbi:MAG TPA: DnaJ domain-containing protein [Spirochaetota bacterium]|nr:DnaJ domain-containing protein [Spirochaetota bacterium]